MHTVVSQASSVGVLVSVRNQPKIGAALVSDIIFERERCTIECRTRLKLEKVEILQSYISELHDSKLGLNRTFVVIY